MHDFEHKRCETCDRLHDVEEKVFQQVEDALDTLEHPNMAPTSQQLEAAGGLLHSLEKQKDRTQKDLLGLEVAMIDQAEGELKHKIVLDHDPKLEDAVEILEQKKTDLEAEIAEPAVIPAPEALLADLKNDLENEKKEEAFQDLLLGVECVGDCEELREQTRTSRLLNKLNAKSADDEDEVDKLAASLGSGLKL